VLGDPEDNIWICQQLTRECRKVHSEDLNVFNYAFTVTKLMRISWGGAQIVKMRNAYITLVLGKVAWDT
jgi:hypothetical protein